MADRRDRLIEVLRQGKVDAAVCGLPVNVLLATGYWPVVGNTLALCNSRGEAALLVPEDERELAARAFEGELRTFRAGSLDNLDRLPEILKGPLAQLASQFGFSSGRIGHDGGASFEPSTYASMHLFGCEMPDLVREAVPGTHCVDISRHFALARAVLTADELAALRGACENAGHGFDAVKQAIREGITEAEVAAILHARIAECRDPAPRAGAFAYCMSGPNASQSFAAFQLTRHRRLEAGDFALTHCNSYAGGFWTDITRTYFVGEPGSDQLRMMECVHAASVAAINRVKPGVEAKQVDAAARDILTQAGFGHQFKHATGHGVGFSAINHNAHPRIHPKSTDRLETGMVFNIEPAIYEDGKFGLRHCTMVAVTDTGCEVLTPFQSEVRDLIV